MNMTPEGSVLFLILIVLMLCGFGIVCILSELCEIRRVVRVISASISPDLPAPRKDQ